MKTTQDNNSPDFSALIEKLKQEFLRRSGENRHYSLRAFAQYLSISPGSLSQLMSGKRPLSEKMAQRLGLAIGISLQEIDQLKNKSGELPTYHLIKEDVFKSISDYAHLVILEFTKVEHFRPDIRWISQQLSLPFARVQECVDRLIRLGLLEVSEAKWLDRSGDFVTTIQPGLTSQAAKRNQAQLLEKAIEAIEEVPLSYRDHTALAMAIDSADLPELKKDLGEFRRFLDQKYSKNKNKNQVYQLCLALYPHTAIQYSNGDHHDA